MYQVNHSNKKKEEEIKTKREGFFSLQQQSYSFNHKPIVLINLKAYKCRACVFFP